MWVTTLSKTVARCSTIWHGCTKTVSSNNQCRVVEASAMLLYIIVDFFSNVLWVGFRQNARKRSSDRTYLLIKFYKGFTEYIEMFRSFRSFSAKPFLQLPFKNIAVIEVELDRFVSWATGRNSWRGGGESFFRHQYSRGHWEWKTVWLHNNVSVSVTSLYRGQL